MSDLGELLPEHAEVDFPQGQPTHPLVHDVGSLLDWHEDRGGGTHGEARY